MKSKVFLSLLAALVSVPSIPAFAEEAQIAAYIVTLDDSLDETRVDKCLGALEKINQAHSSTPTVTPIEVVFDQGVVILKMEITPMGAAKAERLRCVAAVEEEEPVGPQPGVGRGF